MKRPFDISPIAASMLALAAASSCLAITPTEWQHRQVVHVPAPGLVRVELTPSVFEAARPQLEDLRILDPAGNEAALLVDRPPATAAGVVRPSAFDAKVAGGMTVITVTTGTTDKLSSITLETPSPFFLRSAKVEVSGNGSDWASVDEGVPVFREWGAERLELPLGGRAAPFVRVTVADNRDAPLPFTGARLGVEARPAPALVPVEARVSSREEFAGETVLTVVAAGGNIPLSSIGLGTTEPLFMRRISVGVREVRNAMPAERTVASGTIFRVALGGAPVHEQLDVPMAGVPCAREMLVHVYNGDSPPLALTGVTLKRWPVSLLFMANAAGDYTLLSGNPQAAAPRYDLAAFAGEMRGASAVAVTPGSMEDMPDYRPGEVLSAQPMPDVPLTGAPIDATGWAIRRAVHIAEPGVQELELDLGALAGSRPDFGDVRLLREGNQIPYVLEQPPLARSLTVSLAGVQDPKRTSLSIWRLQLPKAQLPVRSIVLASTTSLFQRQFRIYERLTGQDGGVYDNTLASGLWSRTPQPGVPETRVFDLQSCPRSDVLWIETDNGDNPAIALGTAQVVYPVVRIVFKVAETDGFMLAYGNRSAASPHYDLDLVAARLLTASRNTARLDEDAQTAAARNPFAGINGGYVFWGALGLAVVVLLATVAKLLPKPPH